MTNISNWHWLIFRAKKPHNMNSKEHYPDGDCYQSCGGDAEFVLLPWNEYQLGNLLGMLKDAHGRQDGDWWGEILSLVMTAMERLKIKELADNRGNRFTLENLSNGEWLVPPERTTP